MIALPGRQLIPFVLRLVFFGLSDVNFEAMRRLYSRGDARRLAASFACFIRRPLLPVYRTDVSVVPLCSVDSSPGSRHQPLVTGLPTTERPGAIHGAIVRSMGPMVTTACRAMTSGPLTHRRLVSFGQSNAMRSTWNRSCG